MSGTVKTVVIVAGIGVGVFVLVKALAPTTMRPPDKAKSVTDLVSLQGLVGLGSALGGLFGGSDRGTSPQSAPYYGYGGGAYSTTQGIVGNELADHAEYGPVYQG